MRRDGRRCFYCSKPLRASHKAHDDKNTTVDHVLPQALGGTDELSNLVLSCPPCNSKKDSSVLLLVETIRQQRQELLELQQKYKQLGQFHGHSALIITKLKHRVAELQTELLAAAKERAGIEDAKIAE